MDWKSAKFFAVAVCMVAAQNVFAADLPVKAVDVVKNAYDWSGIYIGAHAGWGRINDKWIEDGTVTPSAIGRAQASYHDTGWLGGGQIGFNVQHGQWVWGAELDGSFSGIKGGALCYQPGAFQTCNTDTKWLATASGRLGWAIAHVLPYVKVGYAWADQKYTNPCPNCVGGASNSASGSLSRSGWLVGAGVEAAITAGWSIRLDYSYADLGTKKANFTADPGGVLPAGSFSFSADIRQSLQWVTVGLNYRFAALP